MKIKKDKAVYQSKMLLMISTIMLIPALLNLIFSIIKVVSFGDPVTLITTTGKIGTFVLLAASLIQLTASVLGIIAWKNKSLSSPFVIMGGSTALLMLVGSILIESKQTNCFVFTLTGIIPAVAFTFSALQFQNDSGRGYDLRKQRGAFYSLTGVLMIAMAFVTALLSSICYMKYAKTMIGDAYSAVKTGFILIIVASILEFIAGFFACAFRDPSKKITKPLSLLSFFLSLAVIPIFAFGNFKLVPAVPAAGIMLFFAPVIPALFCTAQRWAARDDMPEQDGPILGKATFAERYAVYIYLLIAFLVPFALMFFAFKVAGVSPYGQNQILVTDLWHQYYPFLTDFQSKLQNGGSLLWTWKSGGGTNYVALMSYYLASPLNFFSVLVPPEKLREFLYIITCVKIGLAGCFFSLFIKISFKRKDVSIAAFGIMYALCAFIMGYYWNVIWLDTIALLPLVIAGTFALLKEGKFKLYIIALALSILANYYIGLFTCVFVLLVSIGYCIVEFKGWKDLLMRFLKMAGCSILSVMMSAMLTLPAYFALHYTHSSDNTFPDKFAINIGSTADFGGVLEGIGKTIANSVAFIKPTEKEGLPNVYCGVFIIFLALLFLFCSKIKLRERLFCCGLLVFFMLSFVIRQLDYVWHGFHFPNMLPYRFSFLYSFVLIYMAFRVFMYIEDIKLASVIGAIAAFFIYLGIANTYYDGDKVKLSPLFENVKDADKINPVVISGFIGMILAAAILVFCLRNKMPRFVLSICTGAVGVTAAIIVIANKDLINAAVGQDEKNKFYVFIAVVIILLTAAATLLVSFNSVNRNHQMTKLVLSVLVLLLAMTEGLFSAASGVKTVGVTDSSYYPLGKQDTLNCVETVNEIEKYNTDLPHTEVNKYYSLNDNALIGANGISMFNSMVNKDITAYMEKFGICGWVASNRYTYQESSPFTNLMLNIKYIIAPYGAYLDTTHNHNIYTSGSVKLMQNQYYLPQGFMVNSALADFNVETASVNPIDNQNKMFCSATGLSGDLYEYLTSSSATAAADTSSIKTAGTGTFTYNSSSGNESYDINYVADKAGVAVAYLSGSTENISIRVNGSEKIGYYIKRPFIMMVGNVNAGDTITLHCTMNNSTTGTITAYCAMQNEALFQQGYNKLSQSTLKATKATDTELCGDITANEDGLFYTSISYAKGWKAYVDGEEVEITPIGNAMLAFPLSKGTHTVELKYIPEGFVVGLTCTILSILIFIALCFLMPKRKQLLARITSRRGTTADGDFAPDKEGKVKKAAKAQKDSDRTMRADDDERTMVADDASSDDEKTIAADD